MRKLWLEEFSASLIAAELGGVSRSAVIGKIHRLGLCGRGQPTSSEKRQRKLRSAGHRGYRLATIGSTALKAEPETLPDRKAKIFESVAVPIAKMLTVQALTERTCKWPIGNGRAVSIFAVMTRSKARPIAATIRASLTPPADDTAFDNSGISVSSAGDVNGDGFDDLISGPDILA